MKYVSLPVAGKVMETIFLPATAVPVSLSVGNTSGSSVTLTVAAVR